MLGCLVCYCRPDHELKPASVGIDRYPRSERVAPKGSSTRRVRAAKQGRSPAGWGAIPTLVGATHPHRVASNNLPSRPFHKKSKNRADTNNNSDQDQTFWV